MNFGTFSPLYPMLWVHSQTNGVNCANKYNKKRLNLRVRLRVNLASKMAAKLSFRFNLEFSGVIYSGHKWYLWCYSKHSSAISGCTCRHHRNIVKGWQLPNGFESVRIIYTNLHTKIFTRKHGKFEKILTLKGQYGIFQTFDKYFAFKQLKTQEFWKNTNVFGFKTAENC